jgi:hypothetical protein
MDNHSPLPWTPGPEVFIFLGKFEMQPAETILRLGSKRSAKAFGRSPV